jgi:hypothetical protein
MAPFFAKPDPVAKIQKLLEVSKETGVGLLKQHAASVTAFDAKTVAVNALAGADDAALEKAEAELTEAEKLMKRRWLFVEENATTTKKLEAELDKAKDIKQRAATVLEYQSLEAELVAEGTTFAASALRMSEIAARIVPIAYEAGGFKSFADVGATQIPEAVALFSRMIREHSASVLRGEAPAAVRKPEPKFVQAVIAKAERVPLFCLRPIKFTDPESGKLIVIQKFQDGEFPPTYARAALEQNVCTRLSDPLRKQHHGTTPGHADVNLAFDLDAAMNEPKPAAIDPIMASSPPQPPSQFEVSDYGRRPVMKVVG